MAENPGLGELDLEHEGITRLFDSVSDPDADRVEVLFGITRRLTTHIAVEQSVLLPLVRERAIGGPEMADSLSDDYHEMQRLLVLIERRKVNAPDMPQLVTELKDIFTAHTQRFSKCINQAVTEELNRDELDDLRQRIGNADGMILSHPHPHLLSLGPISRLTTRLASRVDRMRDRTVRNRYLPSSDSDRESLEAADPRLPDPASKRSGR